ncbi:MAG: hypothetical protein HQL52_08460 [Magnetococcales bacterium]|nr:hypothetical protein [Magnetococcales bacterium]
MAQLVNFYQSQFHVKRESFSAAVVLSAAAGLLVILGLLSLGGNWWIGKQEAQLRGLEQKDLKMANELAELAKKFPERKPSLKLKRAIRKLRREKLGKERLLDFLRGDDSDAMDGFSRFFDGLTDSKVAGIWVTGLGVFDSGDELAIRGRTSVLTPDLVAEFIQKLREQELYEEHSFQFLEIEEKLEKPGLLQFELKTDEDVKLMEIEEGDVLEKTMKEMQRSRKRGANFKKSMDKNMKTQK